MWRVSKLSQQYLSRVALRSNSRFWYSSWSRSLSSLLLAQRQTRFTRSYTTATESALDRYKVAIEATAVERPGKSLSGKPLRIGITEDAVKKLESLGEADNTPDLALKIHVESGGCHGFQYIFDLKTVGDATEKDSIFRRGKAAVIIDHNSLEILRDSLVDYASELIGSQFKITSPHTSSSCGCGTSFSIDPSDD